MNKIEITPLGRKHFETNAIKGVLFDLDGVIIDTEKLYTRFWMQSAHDLGYPMSREQALELRCLNHGLAEQKLKGWFGPDTDYHAVRNHRIELMNAFIDENGVEAKAGIRELLEELNRRQIPYCMATASHITKIERYLTQLDLFHYFDHIVTAYDVPKGKPEPDIYLAAATKIQVPPENCLALEDSMGGLLSAYRAGAAPVLIPDQDQPNDETRKIIAAVAETLEDVIALL